MSEFAVFDLGFVWVYLTWRLYINFSIAFLSSYWPKNLYKVGAKPNKLPPVDLHALGSTQLAPPKPTGTCKNPFSLVKAQIVRFGRYEKPRNTPNQKKLPLHVLVLGELAEAVTMGPWSVLPIFKPYFFWGGVLYARAQLKRIFLAPDRN